MFENLSCSFFCYYYVGTLRVREEKQPGDINGIYFDSMLDSHSMSSAFVKTTNNNN